MMHEPRPKQAFIRKFLLSGFADEAKASLALMICSLGGKCLESQIYLSESTHVISAKPMRSEKFLCACASGKWILTSNYITACHQAKKWLPEEQYEWSNYPGKKYPKELVAAPRRWREHVLQTGLRAFVNWTALVLVEDKVKRPSVYQRVIESGGGHTIPIQGPPLQNPEALVDCVTHVIADPCYAAEIVAFHKAGVPCLSPEYLAEFLFQENAKMDPHRIDFAKIAEIKPTRKCKEEQGHTSNTVRVEVKAEKCARYTTAEKGLIKKVASKGQKPKFEVKKVKQEEISASLAQSSESKTPRELKRKLRLLQGVEEVLQAKRLKKSHNSVIVPPWIKSSYKTYKSKEFPKANPFPEGVYNIIEADIEEHEWMSALTTIQSFLSVRQYPPSELISMIMRQMLKSDNSRFVTAALNVLQSVLCMHSTSQDPSMVSVYLDAMTLHPREEDDSQNASKGYWEFLREVINIAIQTTGGDSQEAAESATDEEEDKSLTTTKQDSASALLRFLVLLIEEDFEAWKQRLELNLKKPLCMLDSIFWPGGRGVIVRGATYPIKQLMRKTVKVVRNSSLNSKAEIQRMRLLMSLVQMVAERCQLINRMVTSPWEVELDNYLLNDLIQAMASAITEGGIPESFEKLRFFLSSMQPVWLRLKVIEALLEKNYMSIMEDHQVNRFKNEPLTLKKIVEYYFTVVPQSAIAKNIPSSSGSYSKCKKEKSSSAVRPLGNSNIDNGGEIKEKIKEEKETKCLMRKMAAVKKKNARGETPLHVACIKNQVDHVRKLLAIPDINVNAEDFYGWTPLHEAANHGHVDCVRELLNFKSQDSASKNDGCVNLLAAPSLCGTTPLHDAVINKHVDVIKLIVSKGGKSVLAVINVAGKTPLDIADSDKVRSALMMESSGSLQTNELQGKENMVHSKDDMCDIPEKRYTELLGPRLAPKCLISGSNCERLCILISHLLKSYLSFYEISQWRTEVMNIINKQSSKASASISTPTSSAASSSFNLSDAFQSPAVTAPGLTVKVNALPKELISRSHLVTNKDRIYEDLETYRKLQVYTKRFAQHVGRISPWSGGVQENPNCKGIMRHMRAMTP